jgi:hypothetical protein
MRTLSLLGALPRVFVVFVAFVVLVMLGCGGAVDTPPVESPSAPSSAEPTRTPAASTSVVPTPPDYATPFACAEAYMTALAARDREALLGCLSEARRATELEREAAAATDTAADTVRLAFVRIGRS